MTICQVLRVSRKDNGKITLESMSLPYILESISLVHSFRRETRQKPVFGDLMKLVRGFWVSRVLFHIGVMRNITGGKRTPGKSGVSTLAEVLRTGSFICDMESCYSLCGHFTVGSYWALLSGLLSNTFFLKTQSSYGPGGYSVRRCSTMIGMKMLTEFKLALL